MARLLLSFGPFPSPPATRNKAASTASTSAPAPGDGESAGRLRSVASFCAVSFFGGFHGLARPTGVSRSAISRCFAASASAKGGAMRGIAINQTVPRGTPRRPAAHFENAMIELLDDRLSVRVAILSRGEACCLSVRCSR